MDIEKDLMNSICESENEGMALELYLKVNPNKTFLGKPYHFATKMVESLDMMGGNIYDKNGIVKHEIEVLIWDGKETELWKLVELAKLEKAAQNA